MSKLNALVHKATIKGRQKLAQFLSEHFLTCDAQMDATVVLEKRCPDTGRSCVTTNVIDLEYDLQVIVPMYKVEKFIKGCMDSILSQQTRFSFCVTVVNDGSPDGSREILRQYETMPNVYIIDQKNRGFSGARNAGLQHIRGGGM